MDYLPGLYDPDLVCVCLSVCLLKLSLLYPAPHMETTMLRISPSFLTKPSEQLAKNNIKCCLRSWPRPPGEDITGEEELIRFKTSPTLASTAATNSKHRPDFLLQAQTAQEDSETERSWGGEFIFLDILSIYFGPRLDRGHFKLFSDTKHVPTQSSGGFILQQACLALLGWAQNCFNSFHSPCCEWAKIEAERGDVLKGGTEEGLG